MTMRPFYYSFNGGEVSPRYSGRADHARYFASLAVCENFLVSPLGGLDRRPGSRFVARAKFPDRRCALLKFEFSVEQAYLLEVGHEYIRFYRDGSPIESSPGVPVEVASPYQEADVFALQTAQSADIMWIVHPSYPPHKLLRFGETTWALQPVRFDPPPSVEAPDVAGSTLFLGAVSGGTVTATSSEAVFLDGDVGRQLTLVQGSLARATITALNAAAPTSGVTLNITEPFPGLVLSPGTWQLDGPLGAGLRLEILGPEPLKGTFAKGRLIQREIVRPELLTNGNFGAGLTGWTDHSGLTLASGVHTGGTGTNLQDTSKHFPALSVRVGMRVVNTSTGQSGTVSAITPDGRSLLVNPLTFNGGQGYAVLGTGGVEVTALGAQLSGGNAGTGWIEQAVATLPNHTYRVTFDVSENPVSIQVGSFPTGTNLLSEVTYPLGNGQEALFTAASGTSYVQIRNNQPTMSRVGTVSVKDVTARGWRPADQGKFIKAYNGVFEILGFDDDFTAILAIRSVPQADDLEVDSPAGAWGLEVPAWSGTRGYPRAISFHQQRLGFAGTALQPLTVWQSEIGHYESFGASALADSSLEQEFASNEMNTILWMEAFRDLLVGTAKGEHLLRGVNGPLTPTNAEQIPQTAVGSHPLRPLRLQNALVLLGRGGRQVVELVFDENGETIESKDHTLIAEHITAGGITQWAFRKRPTALILAVRGDGTLIIETYQQIEQVQGWHRHTTDGAYESVAAIPIPLPAGEDTEAVYVAVKRTTDGADWRSIERFDPSIPLDCATVYQGPATQTFFNLSHLEGHLIKVIDTSEGADKPAVLGDALVSLGETTITHAITSGVIGLDFAARFRPLRPELPQREGTLQGRRKRWVKISARVLRTGSVVINGVEAKHRRPADWMGEGPPLLDGDLEVLNLGWDLDGYITVTTQDPLPCTVLSLYGELDAETD